MLLIRMKFIVQLVLLFSFITRIDSQKVCPGSDVKDFEKDCNIIDTKPLVFKGNLYEKAINEKMSTVESITAGVEIIETSVESFDFLKNVAQIKNPSGPAILLRQNKNLKRIILQSLTVLEGGDKDVVLIDDNGFVSNALKDHEGMADLLFMENVTSPKDAYDCPKFVTFVNHPKSSQVLLVFGIIFVAAAAVLTVILLSIIFSIVNNRKEKNRDIF
uniref:Recep_L_domain domain-containing protein n=1 Tax=Caenorhabditis tropicalis TaxID=1561998 RepID=A0A1I7TGX4_9PELO